MSSSADARVVVCRVGTGRFALPVADVREVIAAPVLARIPGAPPAVRGVANVRGSLVTVVSGPMLLNRAEAGSSEWLLVLSLFDGRVALEVDEVEDLHTTRSAGAFQALDVEALIRPLLG
jgi:purine-binding chemotaxis protein CheW